MSSLAQTISIALQAVGPVTGDRLRDIMVDFDGLDLIEEERLAAVATTIATTACTHHAKHKAVYLDAVRTWSLEIAAELRPAPSRLRFAVDLERVSDGADILIAGIESLIELMSAQSIQTKDRLVTELALISRLLGRNDANTIYMALNAVDRAVNSHSFTPGAIVLVPLRDASLPVGREANLALLEPRGCA